MENNIRCELKKVLDVFLLMAILGIDIGQCTTACNL